MLRRVTTAATQAGGESIRSPPREGAVQAQQGLLHHVLRLARAAQHAVRHREGARPQLLVEVAAGHAARSPSANPWRQLG